MPEYIVTLVTKVMASSLERAVDVVNPGGLIYDSVIVEPVVEPLNEQSADFQRTLQDTIDELGRFDSEDARIEWATETLETLSPVATTNTDYGILRACQHYLDGRRRRDIGSGFGTF